METVEQLDRMREIFVELERTLQPINEMFAGMKDKQVEKTAKTFKETMTHIRDRFQEITDLNLGEIFAPLKQIFEPLKPIIEILSALFQAFIGEILKQIFPLMQPIFQLLLRLLPVFQALGKLIGGFVQWLFGERGLLVVLTAVWEVMKRVGDFVKNVFLIVFEGIFNFFKSIWGGLVNAWNILKTVWENTGGKLFGPDGLIVAGLKALLAVGKGIVNGFIHAINAVIRVINLIPGVNLGLLTPLQKGGIVSAPTAALIGEAGPEVVQPLDEIRARDDALIEEMQGLRQEFREIRRLEEMKRLREI